LWALDRLTTDNSQKEYYVTDCPGMLQAAGHVVRAEAALKACEAMSINTLEELAAVEEEMRRQRVPCSSES
jgi:bifunctional N-acetylglucosamine-1-phosphate-uridyltransferase/glucosamine-1-phosphate-acetyltransferase GlmU-like protein